MRLSRLAIAVVLLSCVPVFATSGSFQLKIFQGYNFATRSVGKSGGTSDLSFTYQVRRIGMIGYLQAPKIKEFQSPPSGLTASEFETWKDYVAGPSPDYYVIKAKDGRCYLLQLLKFENQGKAASYWLMTFHWQEISLRADRASVPAKR